MYRTLFSLILSIISISAASAQHTNLWGVTAEGGIGNAGVIFRYNYTTNNLDTVYNFNYYLAHGPVAGLSYYSSGGRFYGTATTGGNNILSKGGIYSFDPLTYSYALEADFYPDTKGRFPAGRLFETRPGYYWSVSTFGGANNAGTIYTYDAVSNTHTVRRSFSGTADGYDPYDGPVPAPNGKMYGITHGGAGTGGGVIYEIDTLTYTYTIKQQLAYATGNQSQGRLLLASDGNMYGTTTSGGANNGGTFFRYSYATNTLTHLAAFSDSTGKICTGHLIQASDGYIYGVASNGGDSSGGTIFRYSISSNTLEKRASFHPYGTGAYGLGGLCEVPGGQLYGLASTGGAYGKGTLYAFDMATATITREQDFTGANGAGPQFTDLTLATTNTQPHIVLNSHRDTVCAGSRDTLLFSITDPDNDTVQGTLSTSNNALISAAGSNFSRVGNTTTYRLVYAAAAGVTGSANLSIALTDGYGAADTLHTTVYIKDCAVQPPAAVAYHGKPYNGFALSPNPASSYLRLRLYDAADRIVQLRLTDALGRSIMLPGTGTAEQSVDIGQLARGIYHLQVMTSQAVYSGRAVLR